MQHIQERVIPLVVVFCVCLVIGGLALTFWNYGLFFPSWVQWYTFSQKADVNGDGRIEAVTLMNRHLAVLDDEGHEYVTPHDWMVADVELGDLTGDGVPEILLLTWERVRAGEGAVLELPLLGRASGFNQHVHVLDYGDGDARHLWDSAPLNIEACDIHMSSEGIMGINLPNEKTTYWRWENPGFVLSSGILFDEPSAYLR